MPLNGRGADVRWFDVAPCYVFHPLNAFDDGDRVVLDVIRYARMFDRSRLGPDEAPPTWHRWTLDTVTGRVSEEQRSDRPFEFPRVDERARGSTVPLGLRHRDGRWRRPATSSAAGSSGSTRRPAGEVVDLGPGRVSGEWVMIPRHADAAEDDGWLMSLVHDAHTDRSELVVLAADAPDAGPVARVELPVRVPVGFHGNWVPTPA